MNLLTQTEINNKVLLISQELSKVSKTVINTKPRATKTNKRIERKVSLKECRILVGKSVWIVNPKNLQECFGTIIKVGTLYVTIQLPNSEHRRRISSNIQLIEDE